METALQIDGKLVQEHGPALLAMAQRVVHRREDAEDVVQEMWLSAMSSSASFEGRSSLRTWLHAILRHRIADSRRRQRPITPFHDEEHVGNEVDVATHAETRQLAELALQLMPELGELERRALELCTLDDIDRDLACERLGITRGHLRVLIHRARKKLVSLSV
jgi:RNA polymerase sigma-70 factor (ECF subfamily)